MENPLVLKSSFNRPNVYYEVMDYSKLPEEMKIEIISRASLKTFDTIVSTSKQFNKLTYDPYFLHLYKKSNNIVSGFLVQPVGHLNSIPRFAPSKESSDLDLGFLSDDSRILATSDQGLMVFETTHPKCHRMVLYHICKPATKQVMALPNPKTRYLTEKVAIIVMGSNSFHYKILRFSRHTKVTTRWSQGTLYSTYCCEIFDSAKFAWKQLDDIMLPFCVFFTNPQPINIGGSIYILLTNNNVFKFDLYSEKWTTFPLGVDLTRDDEFDELKVVKYERKLALARRPWKGIWEIWVSNMIDNEEALSLEKKCVFKKKEDMWLHGLNSFYDSDTSVVMYYDTLVFYDFKKGDSITKIRLSCHVFSSSIFTFRSDFEIVNLRGRR